MNRLRRYVYRAFWTRVPMGNLLEQAWYMNRTELYWRGFRDGFRKGRDE